MFYREFFMEVDSASFEEKSAKHFSWVLDAAREGFEPSLEQMANNVRKKLFCQSCQFRNLRDFLPFIIEEISGYLCHFRPRSIDRFYELFVSALIAAWVRLEFSTEFDETRRAYHRKSTLSIMELEDFRSSLLRLHDTHNRYVEAISDAMIDCLAVSKR